VANGDIIELLLVGKGDGVIPLVNNFTFQQTVGASASNLNGLATLFIANILPPLVAVLSSLTVFMSLDIKQLTGGTDLVSVPLSSGNVGLRSAQFQTPNDCWSYRYFRSTSASRNGQKRFGLIYGGDYSDGVATGSILSLLPVLASALSGAQSDGTYTWEPRIVRKRLNGEQLAVPEAFSISAVAYTSVGSQNSRKFNKH